MKLFEVPCSDRSGDHVYDVNLIHEFGQFSPWYKEPGAIKRKAAELYIESSQHEVLFSDYTKGDYGAFLTLFLDPRGVWLETVRQTDHMIVGSMYLTNVIRRYDALGHFTFWDSIARGREPIVLEGLKFAFRTYGLERISVEVPAYQSGLIRFIRRIGFTEEGRKRHATLHKGVWIDGLLFSYLREELEDGNQLRGELRVGDSTGDEGGSGESGLESIGFSGREQGNRDAVRNAVEERA